MFVDLCYGKKDIDGFIDIAGLLNTQALCFVGSTKNKESYFIKESYISNDFSKIRKKTIYLLSNPGKKSLHYPLKINQVTIKNIKEAKSIIGIEFNRPELAEQQQFLTKLCKKYKVPVFIATLAKHPMDLRSKKMLYSYGKLLGMDSKQLRDSFDTLENFLDRL